MAAGVRGNANIMKAITRARAIVAKGNGTRDTARTAPGLRPDLPNLWHPHRRTGSMASWRVELRIDIRPLDAPLHGLNQLCKILPAREADPDLVAPELGRGCVEDGIAGAFPKERNPRRIWYCIQ